MKALQNCLILSEVNIGRYIPTDSSSSGWRPRKYAQDVIDWVSNSIAARRETKSASPSRKKDTYCACRCPRGICCKTRSWRCSEACGPRAGDWRPSWDWPRRRDSSPASAAKTDYSYSKCYSSPPFRLCPLVVDQGRTKLSRRTALENLSSRFLFPISLSLLSPFSSINLAILPRARARVHARGKNRIIHSSNRHIRQYDGIS